jgi:hypothetical protein
MPTCLQYRNSFNFVFRLENILGTLNLKGKEKHVHHDIYLGIFQFLQGFFLNLSKLKVRKVCKGPSDIHMLKLFSITY